MSDLSSSAPSIGAIGSIVADAYNDRSKGFLPVVSHDVVGLHSLLRRVARESTFGSRLNVRTFLAKDCFRPSDSQADVAAAYGLLPAPSLWNGWPIECEAVVPVRGHPTVGAIGYFGANAPGRLPLVDERIRQRELLHQVTEMPRKEPREDLRVEILSPHPSDRDVSDIVNMYLDRYTTYLAPFTDSSVRNMTAGSQVVVVRDGRGRVASICVSEIAHIPVPNAPSIHFVEISDAATRKDCEGQGMYTAAKAASIRFIRQANPDAVITTEARANSIGVLRSNVNLDMEVAGDQLAQCVISSKSNEDITQSGKYGNLVVFYVP